MSIWVDADACPAVIKEILFRASQRTGIILTLVANQGLRVPPQAQIRAVQVAGGFDVADHYIVEHLCAGDLVITADIPLASDAIAKGATALNPRGRLYTQDNIRQQLSMRNFMEEMRGAGQVTGGPAAFNQTDRQNFANALDTWIQKQKRTEQAGGVSE